MGIAKGVGDARGMGGAKGMGIAKDMGGAKGMGTITVLSPQICLPLLPHIFLC